MAKQKKNKRKTIPSVSLGKIPRENIPGKTKSVPECNGIGTRKKTGHENKTPAAYAGHARMGQLQTR